jgi:hypothetical protein
LAPVPRWAWVVTVAGLAALNGAFLATVARTSGSMTMMGGSGRGAGSAVLGVLGGVVCSLAWIWFGAILWWRVIGHKGLTEPAHPSTTHT